MLGKTVEEEEEEEGHSSVMCAPLSTRHHLESAAVDDGSRWLAELFQHIPYRGEW